MTSCVRISILLAASFVTACTSKKTSDTKEQEEKPAGQDSATAANTVTLSAAQVRISEGNSDSTRLD